MMKMYLLPGHVIVARDPLVSIYDRTLAHVTGTMGAEECLVIAVVRSDWDNEWHVLLLMDDGTLGWTWEYEHTPHRFRKVRT